MAKKNPFGKMDITGTIFEGFLSSKPKKATPPKKVREMSTGELLNMDETQLRSLSKKEAAEVLRRLAQTANKRMERLRKHGNTYADGSISLSKQSPAYRAQERIKGGFRPFSASGKTLGLTPQRSKDGKIKRSTSGEILYRGHRAAILREIERAQRFLKSKTSTISGTQKLIAEVEEKGLQFTSAAQANRFWEAYNKILEQHPELRKRNGGNTNVAIELVYKTMFNETKYARSVDTTINMMEKKLKEGYERNEEGTTPQNPLNIKRGKTIKTGTIHTRFETISPYGKK